MGEVTDPLVVPLERLMMCGLYEAGEIVLQQDDDRVTDEHAKQAEAKVDRRSVMRSIEGLTLQDHLALVALVMLESQGQTPARKRRVYATCDILLAV